MSKAFELVRFRVSEEHAPRFIEERRAVDEALKALAGFEGAELAQVGPDEWLLIVWWATLADAQAAQAVTGDMPVISAWIGLADAFLAFETAEIRYSAAL